jgi:hypothetical protein
MATVDSQEDAPPLDRDAAHQWALRVRVLLNLSAAASGRAAANTAPHAVAEQSGETARWKQARQRWLDANDSLNQQLEALRVAIIDHAKSEPELANALAEIADKGLNALTANHRVRLMAALQVIGEGDAASVQAHGAQALDAVAAFTAHLAGNEKVDACEGNPWGVAVAIRDTLDPALDEIARCLRSAA